MRFRVFIWLCLLSLPVFAQNSDSTGITFTAIKADTLKTTQLSSVNHSVGSVISPSKSQLSGGLISVFLVGFLGGLAALLMPCIFPMLPLTVSFFSGRKRGVRDAMLYGLSIIIIYVGLGTLVSIVFGADALNSLATNGIFNLLFFLMLVVFAASFLGAFEITLPNRWINTAEKKTGTDGLTGIFMMAAVLALVSFSCTGPIIGTLLVQTATTGKHLAPAIGMLGFGVALALPFVSFAIFPAALARLPRSGNWLNTVKIALGFLELALSLKFLSNVDLAYHWQWFDREVFLVLWILIFGCLGMYLLGKLQLSHDSQTTGIGVPRLFSGILVCAFSLFMVPGLWGAPLKSIAAFLPPQETQDFDLSRPISTVINNSFPAKVKYQELFHAPLGLHAFFDYDEGMAYARKINKPILIDFTGHACVNCRKMEATVWPDNEVFKIISQDYVLIQLYVDDKTEVNDATIGKINSVLQTQKFNNNSQPFYVLLNSHGKLLTEPQGAEYDAGLYAQYLRKGLNQYKTND
jgi:thiol:disulfide interchange protein